MGLSLPCCFVLTEIIAMHRQDNIWHKISDLSKQPDLMRENNQAFVA